MATIVANGKTRDVADGATIRDFLNELGWKPEWVVVEHNGEPVERRRFADVTLSEGDRLEVVRAVAGRAARAVRHRDEGRVERLEIEEGLLERGLGLVRLGREELERERAAPGGEQLADGQGHRPPG